MRIGMGESDVVLKSFRSLRLKSGLRDDIKEKDCMMQKSIGIALVVAVLSGLAIGTQSALSSTAGKMVGATLTGLLVNFSGGAIAGVVLAAIYLRQGNAGFAGLNPTSMGILAISGLLGIGIITGVAYAFPKIGIAAGSAAIIASQMVVAVTVDTLGLTGGQPIPLSWMRMAGLGLLALGTWAILPRG
jgi:transporter family-2 protein